MQCIIFQICLRADYMYRDTVHVFEIWSINKKYHIWRIFFFQADIHDAVNAAAAIHQTYVQFLVGPHSIDLSRQTFCP